MYIHTYKQTYKNTYVHTCTHIHIYINPASLGNAVPKKVAEKLNVDP